jgi:hypothetical protein
LQRGAGRLARLGGVRLGLHELAQQPGER